MTPAELFRVWPVQMVKEEFVAKAELIYRTERTTWLRSRYLFLPCVNLVLAVGWLALSIYERILHPYGMHRPLLSEEPEWFWVYGAESVCIVVGIVTLISLLDAVIAWWRGRLPGAIFWLYSAIAAVPLILLLSTFVLLCGLPFE